MNVTVIILTLNEARHIERAMRSVAPFASRCVVVDSGSSDNTTELASQQGAEILTHAFVNQAQQFNWALDQLPESTQWVFRLDADEVVSEELAAEITAGLSGCAEDVVGFTVPRRIAFLGQPIRYGGLFPIHSLRLFRHGFGRSEDRWMDEHIEVQGRVEALNGELLDDNLNPLSWWIDKHNRYASREALEILLSEQRDADEVHPSTMGKQASTKRWLKENVYGRMPAGLRAIAYFCLRYFLQLGFLDGYRGFVFHALQGFWYRFLVDAKLFEAKAHLANNGGDISATAQKILGIEFSDTRSNKTRN